MTTKISCCRICGNTELIEVLDLGTQQLTGVFPADIRQSITAGPLKLVKCHGDDVCGLLQLQHSFDLGEMYGDNYGYRSGLNASMVKHLHRKVERILKLVRLDGDPVIVDIGSNDSTTLQAYPATGCTLVGIDPTGSKFRQYYPPHIGLIPDFFSGQQFRNAFPNRKARVVTSFSMFYDLESPLQFMREVAEILDDEGVWVFEQSYMPLMLERNSYDTVCHEHLEYYALKQIKWMTDKVDLKIIDVEFNDINGGSFSVSVAKSGSPHPVCSNLSSILAEEDRKGLDTLLPYREFAKRVGDCRSDLINFIRNATADGKRVAALGASTKGNVVLQCCGLTPSDIYAVGEVNKEKFGHFTPGSLIPIVPEDDLLSEKPDYLVVLPWHFKEFFLQKYSLHGAKLVFPLPHLDITSAK
jgi:hypothetical protein